MRYIYCSKYNKELIPHVLVNDSIPDCFAGQDEQEFFQFRRNKSMSENMCLDKQMLPCFLGDTRCFPIYKLCHYQIHENMGPGYLKTCRNGLHLANCTNQVCHHHYKCDGYYCIPHNYVCNGRQDCPLGDDEGTCSNRTCIGFFKCHDTTIACNQLANLQFDLFTF